MSFFLIENKRTYNLIEFIFCYHLHDKKKSLRWKFDYYRNLLLSATCFEMIIGIWYSFLDKYFFDFFRYEKIIKSRSLRTLYKNIIKLMKEHESFLKENDYLEYLPVIDSLKEKEKYYYIVHFILKESGLNQDMRIYILEFC